MENVRNKLNVTCLNNDDEDCVKRQSKYNFDGVKSYGEDFNGLLLRRKSSLIKNH